jgi:UDPglucose--hexose-1-phosphate uridylyltransferase
VTLDHPHGQIYAYPFVPPIVERELESSKENLEDEGKCLFCEVLEKEKEDGRRIVLENDSFTAFVPFFARYTYEVHVYADEHVPSLAEFGEKEERDLGRILKRLLGKYDGLFGFEFPYVMAIHQQPTDGSGEEYSHFHIEFYPPYRTKSKLKYLAGSEIGAGTYINNALAEEKAEELREVGMED